MFRIKKLTPLSSLGFAHYIVPILMVAVIAVVGGYVLLNGSSAATLTGAVYLESGVSGKCLDDAYDKATNGTKIQSYACNKSAAQAWELNTNGTIENANGKCIDNDYGKNLNDNPITVYTCSASNTAEQWKNTGSILKNPTTNKCIDLPYGTTKDGTALQLYTCNGKKQQSWNAVKVSASTGSTGSTSGGGNGGGSTTTGAPTPSSADPYYVNCNSGSDSNSGKTTSAAWKTLSKVTSTNFSAGATIFLERGCTWDGGVTINGNGSASALITVDAYGTGAAPIVKNSTGSTFTAVVTLQGQYQRVENLNMEDGSSAGVEINETHDTAEYNEISDSGSGIETASTGTYALMTHNDVHDLKEVINIAGDSGDYGAVGFDLGSDNDEVSYNTCLNCQAPSAEYGEDGGFVEVYNSGADLYVHNNLADEDNGFIEVGGGSGETNANGIRIDNNILVNTGSAVNIHSTAPYAIPATIAFDDNTFYDTSVTGTDLFYAPANELSAENNIFYSNLSMGNTPGTHAGNLYNMTGGASVGYSLSSSEKSGDPEFVDAAGNNFKLESGSPARGIGVGGLGFTSDYDGVAIPSSKPDAGAFQYVQ